MINTKQKAFTLVELIVVVTILAILATIGFVSYSSYLTWVRDTNRIAQMTSLSDWLNLYSTANNLPIPEENVEVTIGTNLIGYQGYAGANILETINFTKWGLDPKDNTYFSYYLTRDRRFFQLMWFLEESADLTTSKNQKSSPLSRGTEGDIFVNKTYAVNLQDRIPTVSWKKLGILTDDKNTPIQELGWDVDLSAAASATHIARLTNDDSVTGDSLLSINPKASCKRLKQMNGRVQSGTYKINPTWDNEIEVYCDMETDGGGWTYFVVLDTDEGFLYQDDFWWDENYAWTDLILDVSWVLNQGVYSAFYSLPVEEVSFYTNDGWYSSYDLNDWFKWHHMAWLISQVSLANWATQASFLNSTHTAVLVWNKTSSIKWSKDYNCTLTYWTAETLHMLTSNQTFDAHNSIFSLSRSITARAWLFWGWSGIWLWWISDDTSTSHVSQECIDDGNLWDDNTYVVLMWR